MDIREIQSRVINRRSSTRQLSERTLLLASEARAVSDERFSREILQTLAQLLNDPLRKGTFATSLR